MAPQLSKTVSADSQINIVHFDVDSAFSPLFDGVKYAFALNLSNLKQITAARSIDIITLKSSSRVTSGLLAKLPSLKAIMARSVGTDNIDLSACNRRGIAVYHVPDYGAFAIAEHVFALLLTKARKIIDLQVDIKQGKFHYTHGQGFTLFNKTIGIIGVGKTGKEVIKIARAFHLRRLGYDAKKDLGFALRYGLKYVSLDTLLKQSDIICLNIVLNKHTHHLINTATINKMKPGVVLINVSRGEVIDTHALVKHIRKFRFVGLDVLEEELSFSKNHPLLKFDNVLITPHVAFFTDETVKNIVALTHANIQYFLKGKSTNRVV